MVSAAFSASSTCQQEQGLKVLKADSRKDQPRESGNSGKSVYLEKMTMEMFYYSLISFWKPSVILQILS